MPTRVLFPLLLLLAACPGTIDDTDRFLNTESCFDVEGEFFTERCGTAGCHNADDAAAAGNLDLTSPDVASRLVGVNATAACGSAPLAVPSDPTSSVLYTKLTSDYCGPAQMPITGTKLDETELACVSDWIAALPDPGNSAGGSNGAGTGAAGGAGTGAAGGTGSGGAGGM